MSILEQDSKDDDDDDGWQGLYNLMRDEPLWQSSIHHIHNILIYQTKLVLNLILSATGPPASLEGRDDHEM
jgi:hypothetical protein